MGIIVANSTGCTRLRSEQADLAEQMDVGTFLHEHLPQQSMVTVSEAYRAMILLADGEETCDTFDAREQELVSRGFVRPEWGLQREACIDRGSIAFMLCRILRVSGGIAYNTIGAIGIGDRRYAMREMEYLGLMEKAPPYRFISGGELVGLIARADEFMAATGVYEQEPADVADVLESETRRERPPGGGPGS
jgi:hypothetical protein